MKKDDWYAIAMGAMTVMLLIVYLSTHDDRVWQLTLMAFTATIAVLRRGTGDTNFIVPDKIAAETIISKLTEK